MNKTGRVLLITGPGGSGKSMLAKYVCENLAWKYISEDEYWVNKAWSGLRTTEQEKLVQKQVIDDLLSLCAKGKNVVLEFILYKNPPNPLTAYIESLAGNSVSFGVVALKPSADVIIARMKHRGRPNDLNKLESRRVDIDNQLLCLEAEYIKPEWLIDATNLSIEDLYERCLKIIID
jgi:adenylate kinase family enzyme